MQIQRNDTFLANLPPSSRKDASLTRMGTSSKVAVISYSEVIVKVSKGGAKCGAKVLARSHITPKKKFKNYNPLPQDTDIKSRKTETLESHIFTQAGSPLASRNRKCQTGIRYEL